MMRPLRIILAAGGTGGHIFPAEAFAKALLDKGHQPILITDKRYDQYQGTWKDIPLYTVPSATLKGGFFKRVTGVVCILVGVVKVFFHIKKLRPDAVVGFGGYPSFPTMVAAMMKPNLPTMLHEQNALLGRANRIFAPYVTRIAASFEEMEGIGQAYAGKVVFTGNPVREKVSRMEGISYPDLQPDQHLHILVTGGSQGASIFSDVVPKALLALPEDLQRRIRVDQQCRPEDLEKVEALYRNSCVNADLSSFFTDMDIRLAAAHLVICRAGASTIAELLCAGRPSVLVPYRYAMDDHQTKNAQALEARGAARVVSQQAFTEEVLAGIVREFLADPTQLAVMAKQAAAMAKTDAADHMVRIVEEIC